MTAVWITDASHPAVAALARRLEADGRKVYIGGDFHSAASVRELLRLRGTPWALVVSGAAGSGALLTEGGGREIARKGQENVTAAFFACRHCAAAMAEKGEGRIVFLSSAHADKPTGADPAYSISQSALRMLAKEMALLYGPAGLRVNFLALGPLEAQRERFDSRISPADYDAETKIPIRRRVTEEDAAAAVSWLIGPDSDAVNGETLTVDGGQYLYYFDRTYKYVREEDLPE